MIIESNDVISYYPDTEYRVTMLNHTVAAICIITYDDSIFWVNNLTNEVVMDTADGASVCLGTVSCLVLSLMNFNVMLYNFYNFFYIYCKANYRIYSC